MPRDQKPPEPGAARTVRRGGSVLASPPLAAALLLSALALPGRAALPEPKQRVEVETFSLT